MSKAKFDIQMKKKEKKEERTLLAVGKQSRRGMYPLTVKDENV